jgi:hypothetical protein
VARIRSIKPEYWADEDFAVSVPNRDARLLYVGLWNLADEHGRVRGDPRYVKGQLFAYDDDLTPKMIDALLDELAAARKVQRYRSGSGAYLFLPNLAKHQRLEAAKVASRLPAPPDPDESAPMATVGTDESAPGADESALLYVAGSREPVAGGRGAPLRSARTKGTRIPADFTVTPEMVTWAREKCPQVDGKAETEKFVNHWTAKSGKDATKLDWPATWRNWMLNSRDRYGARASPGTDLTPHNGTRPSTAELRAGAGIDIANRLKQQRLDAERDTG